MLRVLFINHVAQVSGAEITLRDLLSHLPAQIGPMVASPGPADAPLPVMLRQLGVQWLEIPPWRPHRWPPWRAAADLLALPRVAAALDELIARVRPDVIHANSLPAALLISRCRPRAPVVWQARDLRAPSAAVAAAARSASAIVAISHAVERWLSDKLRSRSSNAPATKIRVIYNGIDLRRIEATAPCNLRGELNIPSGTPIVGTAAQLVPWKKIHLFLKAAALLAKQTRAHFVVLGTDLFGEHSGYVRWLTKLQRRFSLTDRLHWLGYRSDALSVLAALDIYVHTADAEPLGRSLLEAMALGRPCVAPAAAGPAEIMADGASGMLFPPGDAAAAAGAAIRLLKDRTLARTVAAAAAQRVRQAFDAARMAAQWTALYEELAG